MRMDEWREEMWAAGYKPEDYLPPDTVASVDCLTGRKMSEWINFSERRPNSFPCICVRKMRHGDCGYVIFEAPSRKLASRRWVAWIAFQWRVAPLEPQEEERLIGPLPESHRMTFQEAREVFRRMPVLTYEEMIAQTRRNSAQLARMENDRQNVP